MDFAQDDWFASLESAGYDRNKRTIFLWEGVTLYLGEASVRKTMRMIKANSGAGSVIVADIYSKRFVSGDYFPATKPALAILDVTDEQLGFGIDMVNDDETSLETFVSSENFTVGDCYFMGYNTKKGAWMVVAEIKL